MLAADPLPGPHVEKMHALYKVFAKARHFPKAVLYFLPEYSNSGSSPVARQLMSTYNRAQRHLYC